MTPHSSTLAWKIPWTGEPGGLQSMRSLESDAPEQLHFHFSLSCTGEGNGNPLQCSFLENPRDGEAWWAAVYGIAQSWTWLKRLSSSRATNTFSFNVSKSTNVKRLQGIKNSHSSAKTYIHVDNPKSRKKLKFLQPVLLAKWLSVHYILESFQI